MTNLQNDLLIYSKKTQNELSLFKNNNLSEQAKSFLKTNSNAFLFGLVSEQSVKMETAWSLPYELNKRLGHFNLKRMSLFKQEHLEKIVKEKPSLHRYPRRIAQYLFKTIKLLFEKYNSDATNIWKGKNADEIIKNLKEFSGIGEKKSALGVMLLIRDFGIKVKNKKSINIAFDIHIRRVFLRTGLVKKDNLNLVINSARYINSEFPGELTAPVWNIGRKWCRPSSPICNECPLFNNCPKYISLGKDIKA